MYELKHEVDWIAWNKLMLGTEEPGYDCDHKWQRFMRDNILEYRCVVCSLLYPAPYIVEKI